MPSRPHWLEDAADRLRAEMLANAEAVAERLAPPLTSFDGEDVSRATALEIARTESLADPTYLARDLERMAPPCIPLPDGRMLRSEIGLKNFLAKWKVARPDLFPLVTVAERDGIPQLPPAVPVAPPGAVVPGAPVTLPPDMAAPPAPMQQAVPVAPPAPVPMAPPAPV